MGKKGNWFAIFKRGFTSSSKEKAISAPETITPKEKKKWGFGKSKQGDNSNAFIPLRREPSSIEKILGEAETEQIQQQHFQRAHAHVVHQKRPVEHRHHHQPDRDHKNHSLHQQSSKKIQHLEREHRQGLLQHSRTPAVKPPTAPNYVQLSATKIQAAYRGYRARRSYRSLRALMRLQNMMRGHSVRRQTINTMKCMQMLVRMQSQIRARRVQMVESRALQQQQHSGGNGDKEFESSFGKWIPQQQMGKEYGEWDDSVLTREEIETRVRRKVEAVMKRERALAYAYSHQLLKVESTIMTKPQSSGVPLWWTSLERQLPPSNPRHNSTTQPRFHRPNLTPNHTALPEPTNNLNYQHHNVVVQFPTPTTSSRSKGRPLHRSIDTELRDDASLTSCPALTVPNYMVPTVSAKAKARAHHSVVEATKEKKKRFSFGLAQSIGSFFGPKDNASVCSGPKRYHHRPSNSIGGLSVDSATSMPAGPIRQKYFH